MIDRIRGKLLTVEPDRAVLECGPVDVGVAIPACDVAELQSKIGTNISLHTVFQIDSPVNGTVATPKLLGFVNASTRSFFRALVGVKGMGGRKALRALAQPTQEIAAAILGNDIKALTKLPEVGKKTAETIARELQDIAPEFAGNAPVISTTVELHPSSPWIDNAVLILVELGLKPTDARERVQRESSSNPTEDAQDLVRAVLANTNASP
ncbi:MAG: hypothetical protein CMJ28_00325 [Phycisphaerae bacterium]|nr:hypothetical protein [Phycisphaerae bacterium]